MKKGSEGLKQKTNLKKTTEKQAKVPSLKQQLVKTKEQLVRANSQLKLAKLQNKVTNESQEIRKKQLSLSEFFALQRPDGRIHYITGLKPKEIVSGAECKINLPTAQLQYQIGAREFPPKVRTLYINGHLCRRRPNQVQGNFYDMQTGRYQIILNDYSCRIGKVADGAELKQIRELSRKRENEVMDMIGAKKVKGKDKKEKLKLRKGSEAAKFVAQLRQEGLSSAQAMTELSLIIREARDQNIDPMIFMVRRFSGNFPKNNPEAGYNLFGRYLASAIHAYRVNHLQRAQKKGVKLPAIIQNGRFTKEGLVFISHRLSFDGVPVSTDGFNLQKALKLYGYRLTPRDAEEINKKFQPFDYQPSYSSRDVPPIDVNKVPYDSAVGKMLVVTAKKMRETGYSAAHCWAWVVEVYKNAGVLPPHAREVSFNKVRSVFRSRFYLKHWSQARKIGRPTFMSPNDMGALKAGDMVTIAHNKYTYFDANNQRQIQHRNHAIGHTFLFVKWENPATKEVAIVYDHSNGRPRRNRIRVVYNYTDNNGNTKRGSNITWVIRPRATGGQMLA